MNEPSQHTYERKKMSLRWTTPNHLRTILQTLPEFIGSNVMKQARRTSQRMIIIATSGYLGGVQQKLQKTWLILTCYPLYLYKDFLPYFIKTHS